MVGKVLYPTNKQTNKQTKQTKQNKTNPSHTQSGCLDHLNHAHCKKAMSQLGCRLVTEAYPREQLNERRLYPKQGTVSGREESEE